MEYKTILDNSIDIGEIKSYREVRDYYNENDLSVKGILGVIATVRSTEISNSILHRPDLVVSVHGLAPEAKLGIGSEKYDIFENKSDYTFLEPINIFVAPYSSVYIEDSKESSFKGLWIMDHDSRVKCGSLTKFNVFYDTQKKIRFAYTDGGIFLNLNRRTWVN